MGNVLFLHIDYKIENYINECVCKLSMDEDHKLRCEFCNSAFVYVRIKTKELICRSCGHIAKIKEKE